MSAKALVVCIDGTWNAPVEQDREPIAGGEMATLTNVARTWMALTDRKLHADRPYGSIAPLARQHGAAIYLNCIGSTGSRLVRQIDGGFGAGLNERIRDAYRFLAERWQPGDAIYGFGFSRGAFAVRSLATFIDRLGLPKANNLIKEDELEHLHGIYRRKTAVSAQPPNWTTPADVHFLGLWDTVGALALGLSHAGHHELSPANVRHVSHALALDEERGMFAPEFWRTSSATRSEEVWFAGAHSNVGGGYIDVNLSNISLYWMLGRARANGLVVDPRTVTGADQMDPEGARRPSYNEFWGSYPAIGTLVCKLDLARHARRLLPTHRVHESVVEAMRQSSYRPVATGPRGNRIDPRNIEAVVEPWRDRVPTSRPHARAMLRRLFGRDERVERTAELRGSF